MTLISPVKHIHIEIYPPSFRIKADACSVRHSKWLNEILIDQTNQNSSHPTLNLIQGKRFNRRPWTEIEDNQLIVAVEKFGINKWTHCASFVPTRTGKQFFDRWWNHLRPELNKNYFEEWEDKLIIEQHKIQGNKWTAIASMLQNRSSNSVKNRWYSRLSATNYKL
jgi:myb proto-oncogene protein